MYNFTVKEISIIESHIYKILFRYKAVGICLIKKYGSCYPGTKIFSTCNKKNLTIYKFSHKKVNHVFRQPKFQILIK